MLMLARGLRERGHEQVIVCLEGSEPGRAGAAGRLSRLFPARARPRARFRHFALAPATQTLGSANSARPRWPRADPRLAGFLGLPVRRVASRRVTFFPSDRWTYRLKYGRTCHAVIAVSENIRELSVQAGVPRERITVIPDGIEVPAELPERRGKIAPARHRGNATG